MLFFSSPIYNICFQPGQFTLQGHLAISGDVSVSQLGASRGRGQVCCWQSVGRAQSCCTVMHMTDPTTRKGQAPGVNSAEVERLPATMLHEHCSAYTPAGVMFKDSRPMMGPEVLHVSKAPRGCWYVVYGMSRCYSTCSIRSVCLDSPSQQPVLIVPREWGNDSILPAMAHSTLTDSRTQLS